MEPFLFSFATFISTFLGGLFSLRHFKRVHYIMSFTAGVLIAVCFFDIIPEIFSIVHQKNIDITLPLIAIVVGYLVIHILEKYAALHHSHEGEYATHRHPQVGVVSALGLNIVTPTPEVNLFLPKFFSRFVFIESLEISIMALV